MKFSIKFVKSGCSFIKKNTSDSMGIIGEIVFNYPQNEKLMSKLANEYFYGVSTKLAHKVIVTL